MEEPGGPVIIVVQHKRRRRHKRQLVLLLLLLMVPAILLLLLASLNRPALGQPESPANIQRQRWQQQQQQSQQPQDQQQQQQQHRVRRTNNPSHQQPAAASSSEVNCPPNRLLQGLLAPEHLGSPAASQRQQRAYCECLSELNGWLVTCRPAAPKQRLATNRIPVANFHEPPGIHPAFLQRQAAAMSVQGAHRRQQRSAQQPLATAAADNELGVSGESATTSATTGASGEDHENGFDDNVAGLVQSEPALQQEPRWRQGVAAAKQRQAAQSQNSTKLSLDQQQDDSFMPSSSSDSFTLTQQQQANQNQSTTTTTTTTTTTPASDFQVSPVLFRVKYEQKTKIEIDCDQGAPHYKSDMFQGFNVREIETFLFHNCPLPPPPLSFKLLLSRKARAGGQPVRRHPGNSNLFRRRKRDSDDGGADQTMEESSEAPALLPPDQQQQPPPLPQIHKEDAKETRIRSLTVTLSASVKQRELRSVLRDLDQLRELSLYNLQLNLTNIELSPDGGDLEAEPAGSLGASAAHQQPTTAAAAAATTMLVAPSGAATTPPATPAAPAPAPTPSPQPQSQRPPASQTSRPTTFTAAPPPTTTTTTTTSTTTTTTTTARPATTTQQAATNGRPHRQQPPLPPTTQLLEAPRQTTPSNRQPLGLMGAPRGLMSGQATGTPPQTAAAVTTPAPVPLATVQLVASSSPSSTSQASRPPSAMTTSQLGQTPPRQQQQPTVVVTSSQSVSYSGGNNQRVVTFAQNPATTTTGATSTPASGGGRSTLIASSSSSSSPSSQSPSPTGGQQLHQAPTSWFHTTPTVLNSTPAPQWSPNSVASAAATQTFGVRTVATGGTLPLNSPNLQTTSQQQNFQRQPTTTTNNGQSVGFRAFQTSQFAPPTTSTTNNNQQRRTISVSSSGFSMSGNGGDEQTGTRLAANNRRQSTSAHTLLSGSSSLADEGEGVPFGLGGPASAAFADDYEPSHQNSVHHHHHQPQASRLTTRFKRYAHSETGDNIQQFELSFGISMPNLRILRLDNFIDLSQLDYSNMAAKKPAATAAQSRGRFRRQFEPSDVPERDDGHMSDQEAAAVAASSSSPHLEHRNDESLMAEESNARWMSPSPSPRSNPTTTTSQPWTPKEQKPSPLMDPRFIQAAQQILQGLFSRLTKLQRLELTNNNLQHWPDHALHDSRHSLLRLYLSRNNLHVMGPHSLANLTELVELDLSLNRLSKLPSDIFRDLISLKKVTLKRNIFEDFPPRLLAVASSKQRRHPLELADLSWNPRQLQRLAPDLFGSPSGGHARLLALDLSHCNLADQFLSTDTKPGRPELMLAQLGPELRNLSLKGNNFSELLNKPRLFSKNANLQLLDVSHNQLSRLAENLFNTNQSQLSDLLLNNNQLKELPAELLYNLRGLKRLQLSHNRLTMLSPKFFIENTNMESIDLSHNQLTQLATRYANSLPWGEANSLRHVSLAHNHLNEFECDIFQAAWGSYASLQTLDLSHNNYKGQIQMPVFQVVNDLHLDLSHNSIESISMKALVDQEQSHESFDTAIPEPSSSSSDEAHNGAPSVKVRLAGNPFICDCNLEPLISYARRVATATDPHQLKSIFGSSSDHHHRHELSPGSRYSVLSQETPTARHTRLLYHFSFQEAQCARPENHERRPVAQLSPGDFLCPIKGKLCPDRCNCSYQSAFRTVFVDCQKLELERIPPELTNLTNFLHIQVNSNFSTSQSKHVCFTPANVARHVSTVVINLNNNKLRSMKRLAKLFNVTSNSALSDPPLAAETTQAGRYTRDSSGSTASSNSPLPPSTTSKGKRSPAIIGRHNLIREPRQVDADGSVEETAFGTPTEPEKEPPTSTVAVLEKAEQFRDKSYPLTFELYLDGNQIESISDDFLASLAHLDQRLLQPFGPHAPQGSLPNDMQEQPQHEKLSLKEIMQMQPPPGVTEPSGGNNNLLDADTPADLEPREEHNQGSVFGHQTPKRKAALMKTMSQNQRREEAASSNQRMWSLRPGLALLSLRANRLHSIEPHMLERLAKLIKASNTRIFLGHNPFNCSYNFVSQPQSSTSHESDLQTLASDASTGARLVVSPDDNNNNIDELHSAASETQAFSTAQSAPQDCPIGQLKSWLVRYLPNVGDPGQLYCANDLMPPELKERLNSTSAAINYQPIVLPSGGGHDHDHRFLNSSLDSNKEPRVHLVGLNMYDLCPHSGILPLGAQPSGLLSAHHQRLLLSLAILLVLISLLLLMMLIYFGDTQTILAFIYIHLNPLYSCLRLNESHLDGDKLYDAFVSYSSEDRDIVMQLIERLERPSDFQPANETPGKRAARIENQNQNVNASFHDLSTMSRSSSRMMGSTGALGDEPMKQPKLDRPYRLCIHERDWLPGHLISWNIVNSVQNSRRTILVLSKDFIKSVWFSVEFHTAYYQMLEDKIDRLIVIVRGELPPKSDLDKNLAFLLTTKTYLVWGEKWFWERLHYALPHKARPAPPLPKLKHKNLNHHTNGQSKKRQQADKLVEAKELRLATSASAGLDKATSQQQKPLLMSSIGKDCGNLLLAPSGATSASSSASSSSGSHYLLATAAAASDSSGGEATTNNDLLSQPVQTQATSGATRLTIGPSNSTVSADSGRHTGQHLFTGDSSADQQQQPRPGGVTSILLDGGQQQQQQQVNSKARAKRQEKLQNFVDQSISSHFNLSEL